MWQMVKEEIATGKAECCGSYNSRKQGVQYAPEVLDCQFYDMEIIDPDRKDELIGDFMQCDGKMAIVVDGYQFYLTKRMFDVYGKRIADPHSVIHVNGLAKWKDPDGGRDILVMVDEIVSPELVKCHYFNGNVKGEVECPWTELTAA